MTRKKVKLAWIVNNSARKASLKKRRLGLLKKVSELTTLCGVDAFVIVYSPGENEPVVWPSPPVVQQLLARFQSLPEIERSKKLMNQETYLKERVGKVLDQNKKLHSKNLEVEVNHLMSQIYKANKTLDEFHTSEIHSLAWLMVEKKKEIRKRVDYLQQVPLPPGYLPPQGPVPGDDMGRIGSSGGETNITTDAMIDQWFIDLMKHTEDAVGSSSVRNDIRPPHNTLGGSSSDAKDMGMLPHGTLGGHTGESGMGLLPHGDTGGSSSGNVIGPGIQPQGNIGGGNSADDIGLGPQPHGTGGVSIGGSETGLPFGIFGGGSEGSDIGLPFDVSKTNLRSNFPP